MAGTMHEAVRGDAAAQVDGVLDDPEDVAAAVRVLTAGRPVAHGFANISALTTRGDGASVRAANRLTGRPEDQVASVTLPPARLADVFDWRRLTVGVSRARLTAVVDAFFALGPFGFRGPAVDGLDPLLTATDGGRPTVQVIAPGYACPANAFLAAAVDTGGGQPPAITSANRSRHAAGTDSGNHDAPAHWRAVPLLADFGPGTLAVLRHRDEAAVQRRYPHHAPMSTTILGFHRIPWIGGRPHLVLERHGSLPDDIVRAVLARLGFGMLLGPGAGRRPAARRYDVGR